MVTATKRATSSQKVPLAISVLSGDAIADKQLRDGIALARETPNLVAESISGAASPRYRLRGIGSNDFVITGTSSVGIYEDEVFLNSPAAQSAPLYDLERVEILYGPQGSLWGKNTVAGTLAYVTEKPSQTTSGQGRLTYGSDNTVEAEAAFGGGLTKDISARVAGVYKRRDGQFYNEFTRSKIGKYEIWDLRGQLLWNFAGGSLLVKANGGESRQEVPIMHVGVLTGGADADGYIQSRDPDTLSNNFASPTKAARLGATARLIVGLGGPSLTNIASYNRSSSYLFSDDDGGPIARYGENLRGRSRTFTDELRVASQDNSRFGWIAGLYYLRDKTNSSGSAAGYSNTDFGVGGVAYDLTQTTDNYAAFASLSYRITPRLKITAGARYNWEKKAAGGVAYDYVLQVDPFNASIPAAVFLDTANRVYNFAGQPAVDVPPGSRTYKRLTWDGSIAYEANNVLFYGRIARGFRSGNYNTYVAAPGDFGIFKPETLTSYEVGAKSNFFNRRLTFNIAAYHYDFRDLQVFILQTVGSRPGNANKARVNGLEVAATVKPVSGLSFTGSYGLADTKYTDFANASAPPPINRGAPLDLTGQSFERAPKHTINLEGNYEVQVGPGKLKLNTDWRYTSRFRFQAWSDASNANPAPFLASPGVQQIIRDSFSRPNLWLGNARVAYALPSGLELSTWIQNLTNKRYYTSAFGEFFNRSISPYPGERRTYGVSGAYKF